MVCRVLAVAFAVCVLAGSSGQQVQAGSRAAASLQPILDVLDKAKLSGSLEFSGACDMGKFPNFPPLRTLATRSGDSPLQILREMFADDPAMQVTQAPDGTIRMIEAGVPTDLPDLRIRHALFENGRYAMYNPNIALRFILRAPEVVAFMKDHDIGWPYTSEAAEPAGQWPTELPHISGSLDNVALSEALDHVLKTFPGIWIYENCPQNDKKRRVVYFRFFYLRKIGSRASVDE